MVLQQGSARVLGWDVLYAPSKLALNSGVCEQVCLECAAFTHSRSRVPLLWAWPCMKVKSAHTLPRCIPILACLTCLADLYEAESGMPSDSMHVFDSWSPYGSSTGWHLLLSGSPSC